MQSSTSPQKFNSFIIMIIGLLLTVGITYGLYELARYFLSLEKEIAAAIIASTATITVSVFSTLWDRRTGRRIEIEQKIRERKIPIYEKFISKTLEFTFAQVESTKQGETKDSKTEATDFFRAMTPELMIWATDDVLAAWSHFKTYSVSPNQQNKTEVLYVFEDLIRAIRKDIGHDDALLKDGDILSLFVNDISKNPRIKGTS